MAETLRRGLLGALLVSFVAANFALQSERLRGPVTAGGDPAMEGQPPQGRTNVWFARQPDLGQALRTYPRFWVPAYPVTLWLTRAVGAPLASANLLFFLATLALLWRYLRLAAPGLEPAIPVAAWAVAHFNYVTLHEYVSETLFTLLALASLHVLARHRKEPTRGRLAVLCGLGALAGLTRYFALFWTLPLVGLSLVRSERRGARPGWTGPAVYLLAAVLPVALWMGSAYRLTGHLTGTERFAPRETAELTTLSRNLEFSARSLLIDWFSPTRSASHAEIEHGAILTAPEALGGGLLLACLAIGAAALRRRAGGANTMPAQFALAYLLALIALWTLGNNDPIYRRFMHPAYVFCMLALTDLYLCVRRAPPWRGATLPFLALSALFVVAQLSRNLA